MDIGNQQRVIMVEPEDLELSSGPQPDPMAAATTASAGRLQPFAPAAVPAPQEPDPVPVRGDS
jgi:hypothetical protein